MCFGQQLVLGLIKFFEIVIDDIDRASMIYGFDIELDYGLHIPDEELSQEKLRKKKEREAGRRQSKLPPKIEISQLKIGADSKAKGQ